MIDKGLENWKENNPEGLELIQTLNGAIRDFSAQNTFNQPGIQSFFARFRRNPGLNLNGIDKQVELQDGTRIMIGHNGAIVVTGLQPTDNGFTKTSALRQGTGVAYHDFPMAWEQTRWLMHDVATLQTFDDLKKVIESYKQNQE